MLRAQSISALLQEHEGLTVDDLIASQPGVHAGQSGFRLLTVGTEAFLARAVLAARAQRSLDLQYYIFRNDTTGSLLSELILRAADRGVHVRLLVDGFNLIGRDYHAAVLNMHPNVELRLFNPIAGHAGGVLEGWAGMLAEPRRANRRMHNKVFIADGQLVVLGGRNVGDWYFGASDAFEFGDIDVLCAGPLVAAICASFDEYWNSSVAKTLRSVGIKSRSMAEFGRFRGRLSSLRKQQRDSAYGKRLAQTTLAHALAEKQLDLQWAAARLIVDAPNKVTSDQSAGHSALDQFTHLASAVQRELLLVSPYFVPGQRGVSVLATLRARGIRVCLITNSLASTDVIAVHGAYRHYRQALLEMGIEIYEIKSLPAPKRKRRGLFVSGHASLHAKVYVYDRVSIVVGSLNLDPRSMFLNTEIGVLIQSDALAGEIGELTDLLVSPDYSYQLRCQKASGQVIWIDRHDKLDIELLREPGASLWRRISASVLGWLPIEDHL